MIAFGCSITAPEVYERCAEPGIELAREPDSEVLAYASAGSIFRSYNLLLDMVADRDDLETLVLLHQDTEIVDPNFCEKLRGALRDPDIAIVGCAGAVGVQSIAYWDGSVTWGSFTQVYREWGGGDVPALTWNEDDIPAYARTGEVDTLDGFVLAMSPWAVRNLRFDESLGEFHGYDFDICLQARAAGKKVVTENLRVIHHHSLKLLKDPESWKLAHARVAEKWDGRIPGVGEQPGDWKERARRAEADAAAARLRNRATGLERDAKLLELERELEDIKHSSSWVLTTPARALGRYIRRLRSQRGGDPSSNGSRRPR
ncbi:MAG: glycosyltransferase [Solirubrobacterales bacterium]